MEACFGVYLLFGCTAALVNAALGVQDSQHGSGGHNRGRIRDSI
jgi:hypothetical protein